MLSKLSNCDSTLKKNHFLQLSWNWCNVANTHTGLHETKNCICLKVFACKNIWQHRLTCQIVEQKIVTSTTLAYCIVAKMSFEKCTSTKIIDWKKM